jgi:hypothetical protein
MTLERQDEALSEAEIEDVQRYARDCQRFWAKRIAYSVALLLISCASVIPFSKGHSLHAHAEPFGRLLVWLSMGLFLLCTYCAVMTVMSWVALREVLKDDARSKLARELVLSTCRAEFRDIPRTKPRSIYHSAEVRARGLITHSGGSALRGYRANCIILAGRLGICWDL